jgi:NAD(P)-dependent dehydrogenase (short-subunit alcohol dehydrogenase family)
MTGNDRCTAAPPYATAKMGIIGLMRTLAVELGPHGIRANTVCPERWPVRASRRHRSAGRHPRHQPRRGPRRVHGRIPLSRLVGADEVAAACAYLASDAASSVTGEDLNVSAGAVMY